MSIPNCESRVLEYLTNRRDSWVDTATVVRGLGYRSSTDEHTQIRSCLSRLVQRGKIQKKGTGNFYWRFSDLVPEEGDPVNTDTEWIELPKEYAMQSFSGLARRLGPSDAKSTWFPKKHTRDEYDYDLGRTTWKVTRWIYNKKIKEGWNPETCEFGTQPAETPKPEPERRSWERKPEAASSQELQALKTEIALLKSSVELQQNMMVKLTNENVKIKDELETVKRTNIDLKITIEDVEIEIEGVTLPTYFNKMLDLAKCGMNIMLVGPAGCGKSYAASLLAKTLDRRFGSVSCTAGMSESHLVGKGLPNIQTGESVFQNTDFLRCFEKGGVFLLDEMDAADPNMLLCFNSALANGWCNVPNRTEKPRAEKHDLFVCVGAANTFGRGADRAYAGRNALDEASLDRFRIGMIEVDYDPAIEMHLCPDEELRTKIQNIRERANEAGLRRIVSTRFLENAYRMKAGAGWQDQEIINQLTLGWRPEELSKVL